MGGMGELVLLRHGETEWSAARKHTSYTDVDLTPDGERQATALAAALAGRSFAAVLCSPRRRAMRTAALARLAAAVDDDLAEWNYGSYEGRTTNEIRRDRPQWNLWTDGAPGGESPAQIQQRIDRLLARVRPAVHSGDVALVGHGHALRVVGARWIGLAVAGGGLLALDTATICVLGHEHGRPVIRRWNLPPVLAGRR